MVRGAAIDYAALFRDVPTPYLVMTPDLVVLEADPAYLTTVGRTREELARRSVFEAFPPAPDALDDSGVPRVQLSFEGSTLLLHTDGLVERRDVGLDAGFGRLVEELSTHGGADADAVCDALLAAVAPDGNGDDIALLVLCVDAASAGPETRT